MDKLKLVGKVMAFLGFVVMVLGLVIFIATLAEENRRKCNTWSYSAESETEIVYKSGCGEFMTMPKPEKKS